MKMILSGVMQLLSYGIPAASQYAFCVSSMVIPIGIRISICSFFLAEYSRCSSLPFQMLSLQFSSRAFSSACSTYSISSTSTVV